jgi:membrane protease YdiL (CAAX protease family)
MDQIDINPGNSIPSSRKEQLIEVSVFLFLIVPSMVLSFFVIKPGGAVSFVIVACATILRDLGLVSLVIFFLWRNRESVRLIGWISNGKWKEAALGAALFVPFFFGAGLLENILHASGLSVPSKPLPSFFSARGTAETVLAVILVVIVAQAEETIFRGYLILRFKAITQSAPATVLLSSVLFSLGHGYEGSAGVVTVGVMGAVFAIIYMWRKNLAALIVMHFLQDFVGIVLIPLLGSK